MLYTVEKPPVIFLMRPHGDQDTDHPQQKADARISERDESHEPGSTFSAPVQKA